MIYKCESCGEEFLDQQECLDHIKDCKGVPYVCAKCGKVEYFANNIPYYKSVNQWHNIDLGQMGYGSEMDGINLKYRICDHCVLKEILSFKHPELILGTDYKEVFGEYI